MTAIAGIAAPGAQPDVNAILERTAHRGPAGRKVRNTRGVTLGVCLAAGQPKAEQALLASARAEDRVSASQFASARPDGQGGFILERDALGAAPLYYGYDAEGRLCFASEVKGLLGLVEHPSELPPGGRLENGRVSAARRAPARRTAGGSARELALELRQRLEQAVEKLAGRGVPFGSWLSGGLDSSLLAALASRHAGQLHTFAAGFEGAPDLAAARLAAEHIGAAHHEITPTFADITAAIPEVIYHLESFDALLVRSSVMHYLAARRASDYVPAVLTGEGADELFGGYAYLKELPLEQLPGELVDLTGRLHNTALQRVDRCAAAFGLAAYIGFLDASVVELAMSVPARYKISGGVEKWILRQAAYGLLPASIVSRAKAKFWEGAGVEARLQAYAEEQVSDADFARERKREGGVVLNSKEELLYYRIFAGHFGEMGPPDWVGRTKGAPVQ